jgi:hypothetical protein
MKNWKTKLFGDNKMNFYGWLCVGLILMFICIACIISAGSCPDAQYRVDFLLVAILMPVIGLFGIAIQNYLARVAKNIEDQDRRKENDHVA